jgi:nucleoside-diphosphate-sugar epimerase
MERDGLNGETLNIGNPDEMSVEEIARLIIEITGSTSTIEFVPAREDDPKRRCPDISKAKKLIEWQPTVSARDGLAQTIAYLAAE